MDDEEDYNDDERCGDVAREDLDDTDEDDDRSDELSGFLSF